MTQEMLSLYQKDVLGLLKRGGILRDGSSVDGRTFFCSCVAYELNIIAQQYGCSITLNPNRLIAAWEKWVEEIGNQNIFGGGPPDHYKHAGLLAYWLRRKQVVDFHGIVINFDTDYAKNRQSYFVRDVNELPPFLLGFNICIFYSFSKYRKDGYSLMQFASDVKPSDQYMHDLGIFLKEKHVSPHSLYLIYRAFFETSVRFRGGVPRYT